MNKFSVINIISVTIFLRQFIYVSTEIPEVHFSLYRMVFGIYIYYLFSYFIYKTCPLRIDFCKLIFSG